MKEFETFILKEPNLTTAKLNQIKQMVNKDGDGKVTYKEFAYWLANEKL